MLIRPGDERDVEGVEGAQDLLELGTAVSGLELGNPRTRDPSLGRETGLRETLLGTRTLHERAQAGPVGNALVGHCVLHTLSTFVDFRIMSAFVDIMRLSAFVDKVCGMASLANGPPGAAPTAGDLAFQRAPSDLRARPSHLPGLRDEQK